VVPLVDFYRTNYVFKGATQAAGNKESAFTLGLGMNIDVNTDNLLIFALQLSRFKWEYSAAGTDKSAFEQWDIPAFFLALESNVRSWLTARVGAWKSLAKITSTHAAGKDLIETTSDFAWVLGAGFHVAEFDVDLVLSPNLPFRMGYWLTGYEGWTATGDAPIGRISAVYHF